ncbi:MAG: tpiA [Acidobacteria bacterium]|nr:tpiA [Acidobacteriota bacterium]
MPNRYLVANWKMNLPPEGIEAYLRALLPAAAAGAIAIVVAPPFPYLRDLEGVSAGAQNCADQVAGAYTGEVSPRMLRDCGVSHVIVGHSERRTIYGETDSMIARKLALAIETGLTPILCIGEDLRVREAGHVARFLADQIKAVASDVLDRSEVVVAYEPIWAIGTGRNATGAICAEACADIREALRRFWPARRHDAPLLYGGSVTPENVDDLVANGDIDGFLVGGASLDSAKFLAIHAALAAS